MLLRRLLLTIAVATGVLFAVAAPSFGGTSGVSGGSLLLTDDDGGAPMFQLTAMGVGASHERCMRVTNAGTRPVNARVLAHTTGYLVNRLRVEVTRGTLPGGTSFAACTGFTPDASVQTGLGPGVIFRGTLADFATRFSRATPDPGVWAAGATRGYRFTVTLLSAPSNPSSSATASFVWKARGA
jgi:hypothetical protein